MAVLNHWRHWSAGGRPKKVKKTAGKSLNFRPLKELMLELKVENISNENQKWLTIAKKYFNIKQPSVK